MQKQIILFFFLIFSALTYAQNINGIWKGKLNMGPGGCFPVYNIEFQLQVAGSKISGVSYYYSDTTNFVKETFEGTYKADSNLAIINEMGVTSFHIPNDCAPCIKKYLLSFHKGGGNVVSEEQLRGTWTGKTIDLKTQCPPGSIVLTRFDKSAFKPELKLPDSLTKRKAELVKEIKVDTGTIQMDFYDNGQIDGDTISVYINNMPSVSNRMLKASPISIKIRMDAKRPEQEVIMVGENLGSIPPNSALMIVTVGEKRYLLYLNSDETKNAMVRFIYEKPEIK